MVIPNRVSKFYLFSIILEYTEKTTSDCKINFFPKFPRFASATTYSNSSPVSMIFSEMATKTHFIFAIHGIEWALSTKSNHENSEEMHHSSHKMINSVQPN